MRIIKLTLLLCLLNITAYTQETKTMEGYFNLSEFEMAAELFLLNDGSFFYSAVFGAVDLEIYGTYSILGNDLYFHPYEEQTTPYLLYARPNEALKDSISFNYINESENQIAFGLDDHWVTRPMDQQYLDEIKYSVKKSDFSTIRIGFPSYPNKPGGFLQVKETYLGEAPKGMNEFILSYNYYASMIRQFTKEPMTITKEGIEKNGKNIPGQSFMEEEKKDIIAFIKKYKKAPASINVRGLIYQIVPIVSENKQYKLKADKSGILHVLKTYDKQGVENEEGNYFYESGELREIMTYERELEIGQRKWFYSNGQIEEIGHYKNEEKEGRWLYYYPNGNLKASKNFKDGTQVGQQKYGYANGETRQEGTFNNEGEKTGEWKEYFENGQLKLHESYKKGERIGQVEEFYENGQLKESGLFGDSGKLGYWKSFHENGKIFDEDHYFNGRLIDKIIYHDNGQLAKEIHYDKENTNTPVGTWISYFQNGQLEEKETFSKGKRHGEFISYHSDGQLRKKGNYVEGKKEGAWEENTDDLKSSGHYKDDNRSGEWVFKRDGELYKTIFYDREKGEETWKSFVQGRLYLTIFYNHKKGEEIRKSFYENGQLEYRKLIINDKLVEDEKWDESGNKIVNNS